MGGFKMNNPECCGNCNQDKLLKIRALIDKFYKYTPHPSREEVLKQIKEIIND